MGQELISIFYIKSYSRVIERNKQSIILSFKLMKTFTYPLI